jgi:hypothetical protein
MNVCLPNDSSGSVEHGDLLAAIGGEEEMGEA